MLKILFFLLLCFDLLPETIIFRNGAIKKGTIISQDKTSLALEEKPGSPPNIYSKKEILKISQNDLNKDEIKKAIQESGESDLLKDVTPSVPVTPKIGSGTYESKEKGFLASKVRPTRFAAFWRSALIPGWGQLHQNRAIPGASFFFFYIAGAGFAYYQNKEYGYRENDYNYANTNYILSLFQGNTVSQFIARQNVGAERNDLMKAGNRAEIAMGVFAGIYVLNLVDVLVFHPKSAFAINAGLRGDQMALRFELRF